MSTLNIIEATPSLGTVPDHDLDAVVAHALAAAPRR